MRPACPITHPNVPPSHVTPALLGSRYQLRAHVRLLGQRLQAPLQGAQLQEGVQRTRPREKRSCAGPRQLLAPATMAPQAVPAAPRPEDGRSSVGHAVALPACDRPLESAGPSRPHSLFAPPGEGDGSPLGGDALRRLSWRGQARQEHWRWRRRKGWREGWHSRVAHDLAMACGGLLSCSGLSKRRRE